MSIYHHWTAFSGRGIRRLKRWVLGHRVHARHPSMTCDSTAIWDYGYDAIDAIEIGERVSVGAYTEIIVYRRSPHSSIAGRLVLGDDSVLATGVNIRAAGGTISIGARSVLSQHTVAVAANHDISHGAQYLRSRWNEERVGVTVGSNVWVGANCVLLPGTTIGDDSVIAAGSVVRGAVPAGEVWGGVPAKKIRNI